MLVRKRNAIAPTPLKFRLSNDTDVKLLCSLQILLMMDRVPQRGLCGAEGCVENLTRARRNVSNFMQDARNVRITYGQVSDYYFLRISIAFWSEVKISLLQASRIHLLPFEHFFMSSVTIWGCSGQVYRLLLFKSRSTHFFFFKLPCSHEKHVWLRTKQILKWAKEISGQIKAIIFFLMQRGEKKNHSGRSLHIV